MCTEMHVSPHAKGIIKFSDFSENCSGSTSSRKNSPIANFMKIHSAVSEFVTCLRSDGRDYFSLCSTKIVTRLSGQTVLRYSL